MDGQPNGKLPHANQSGANQPTANGASRPADEPPVRFDLLTENPVYKPFRYPWAYEAWLTQQRVHWLPEEVPLADDVKDWHRHLSDSDRNLLTQIFRFFTQADVEVNNCYMKHYSQVFKPTEVLMMLSAFSNTETIHIAAYSHLLDTIGMPELEYQAFMKYKAMKDKYDFMQGFNVDSKFDIARTLAAFGAFTEGLQLFASFAILLNFPRHGTMKGMGQIISWSVRDETLHCNSIIRLFRTFVRENPEIWNEDLKRELYLTCATIIEHRGRLHRPRLRAGAGRGPDRNRGEGIHPLHRRPPAGAARAERIVPRRRQPAALAGRDAERPWSTRTSSRTAPPNTARPRRPGRGRTPSPPPPRCWSRPGAALRQHGK